MQGIFGLGVKFLNDTESFDKLYPEKAAIDEDCDKNMFRRIFGRIC